MNNMFKFKGKKRQSEELGRELAKNPRIEVFDVDNSSTVFIESSHPDFNYYTNMMNCDMTSLTSYGVSSYDMAMTSNITNDTMMINSPYYSQEPYITIPDDAGLSSDMKKLDIDKQQMIGIARTTIEGVSSVANSFSAFVPLITSFLEIGKEIITLYERAEHNKELCGSLLKRCNFAMAAVRDLDIRKTENAEFFSRRENYELFAGFVKCMKKIKHFIANVSQLSRLKNFIYANSIDEDFRKLSSEFEGYMNSLNFSFVMKTRDDFSTVKYDVRQIKDMLLSLYGISDDRQAQKKYFDGMDSVSEKNKEFQKRIRQNSNLDSSEFQILEENEPLLDGSQFHKANIFPSKRIGKRISVENCVEYCFKEFSNHPSPLQSGSEQTQTQIEIRRQVNILKELKNSDHIIRFYGVAREDDTKYYLVTEWMEHGNLNEYYTKFRDSINLEIKIKFALDICRGVAYLHGCRILHRDIQSANILVNEHNKVRIANFGLSKKFSDITGNITHNLENIRYMAPEKLFLDHDENNKNDESKKNDDSKKKKVSYDARCEIYSVGALLWEIAELTKPHSDLTTELLINIRKRVKENYIPPFSADVPDEWRRIVTKAMEFEPDWRIKISDVCYELYKLNKSYNLPPPSPSSITSKDTSNVITILSVDDAIREHKTQNGNKRLAFQSFSYHSMNDIEAKYWVGYYYYHEDIPDLQLINKEERNRVAINIFKETADKGNPSAQLRYGMCLWKGEGVRANSLEALRYLEMAANSNNAAAMYIIGKAYWNGGNGISQNKALGAEYLKRAALNDHPAAKDLCKKNHLLYNNNYSNCPNFNF